MEPMRILEVGMHWFPDGGGGADRYFHGLVLELVGTILRRGRLFSVRGGRGSGGQVRFLGSRKQSLPQRLQDVAKRDQGRDFARDRQEPS